MAFNPPPAILQKIMAFKALRHENGQFLFFNIPSTILPVQTSVYLCRSLIKQFGEEAAQKILYDTARFQANMGMKIVNERFGYAESFGDKKKLLEFNLGQLAVLGLGEFRITRIDLMTNDMLIEGSCPFAEEYKRIFGLQKNPVDVYVAGVLAGGGSAMVGENLITMETSCIAQGKKQCEFVIKSVSRLTGDEKKEFSHLLKDRPTVQDLGSQLSEDRLAFPK